MAKVIVPFDTETRSEVPIDYGRWPYVGGKYADMICLTYRESMVGQTKLWRPGMAVPHLFKHPEDYIFKAHNISFDWLVIETLGGRYGFKSIPPQNCVDTAAIAARYGLPRSLDKLGQTLGVKLPKLKIGRDLKKLFCMPPFHNPKEDKAWHAKKRLQFYDYAIRDVDCMCEIISKLPMENLSEQEQSIWLQTFLMNNSGVPVDTPSVKRIHQVVEHYLSKETTKLPGLTDGRITTVHQRQRIIDWADERGVYLPNLQKDTVDEKVCDIAHLPEYEDVHKVLRLRQLLGGAAIKKFTRLRHMTCDGHIRDNAIYHGAGTGRTTGSGFQFLNLPRASTDDPEILIKKFEDGSVLRMDDPMEEAKKLVRPMIKAPEHETLMVADWSSIEYILLMWYAGETEKVEAFRKGADPYKLFAVDLFDVEYDKITKEQRQKSKPAVLGSGYMLGWRGLIGYADGYGVEMDEETAQYTTFLWRQKHPLVVQKWYKLKDAAHSAVLYKRRKFEVDGVSFQVQPDRTGTEWLIMTLPSGRSLFYCQPQMYESTYGPAIKHMGINPKTKQWGWVYLKPQRIIENVIQGLGRDILQFGMSNLITIGYNPRATIYDEILCLEPLHASKRRLMKMIETMCISPPWGLDLPLRAEGYLSERFKKG